jgi:lipoprotein-anchoring transpeptidase ErfK/SrfK
MAEPPDPTTPDGPADEPEDTADGWVRPSQRRASPPPSGPPTLAGPSGSPDPEPTAAEPNDPEPTEAIGVTGAAAADASAASGATRQRRRARHRNRRRAAISAGAVALVLAIVAGFLLTTGGGSSKAAPRPKPKPAATTTTVPAAPPPSLVATTKVASLQVYDQPAATGKVVTTLSAKTDYGLPRTLLATEVQPGWLQVLLPIRPNSTQGWVRASDVTTTTTDYLLRIALSTHHLTLTKAGVAVFDTAVVIGKNQTPTPTGLFYVTDPVDLQASPNGPYGAFALGLSGFSNVLTSFNGGPGQIAVHGTPYADQVGQDLSNGCVRIPNPLVLILAKLVPLGTPVAIGA